MTYSRKAQPRQAHPSLGRRDFLKLGGVGVAALFLNPLGWLVRDNPVQLGRVVTRQVKSFTSPNSRSSELDTYYRDQILEITDVTVNDSDPSDNKTWYEISNNGFVNSSNIQPVSYDKNPVIYEIPAGGALAEVTIPFTEAYRGPGEHFARSFKLYYESTHWVTGSRQDDSGNTWYHMVDDRWLYSYYAAAETMRIIKPGDLDTISPQTPPEGKRLEVRLDEQLLIAYEWDMPVFMALASTGKKLIGGLTLTPEGAHTIYYKRPNRHMLGGTPDEYDYDLPGVPWVSYFTHRGIAIHGTYWHNNFGKPISHGCVNLPPKAAKWIYQWTHPVVQPNEKIRLEDKGTTIAVLPSANSLE
jgi:hypothetical protein